MSQVITPKAIIVMGCQSCPFKFNCSAWRKTPKHKYDEVIKKTGESPTFKLGDCLLPDLNAELLEEWYE